MIARYSSELRPLQVLWLGSVSNARELMVTAQVELSNR